MRKLTAIIAALGFLATTSLTPVYAAQAFDTPAKSDDLSAAKKKAKKKGKKAKKTAELTIADDLSAAKKKKKKAKKKAASVILYRIAA